MKMTEEKEYFVCYPVNKREDLKFTFDFYVEDLPLLIVEGGEPREIVRRVASYLGKYFKSRSIKYCFDSHDIKSLIKFLETRPKKKVYRFKIDVIDPNTKIHWMTLEFRLVRAVKV